MLRHVFGKEPRNSDPQVVIATLNTDLKQETSASNMPHWSGTKVGPLMMAPQFSYIATLKTSQTTFRI